MDTALTSTVMAAMVDMAHMFTAAFMAMPISRRSRCSISEQLRRSSPGLEEWATCCRDTPAFCSGWPFPFRLWAESWEAAIVFLFLTRVLLAHERPLNALDYEMVGVYGQLTSAIREGGTGEISFSQEGVRRGAPARSEDGTAIQKNTDVVVTRYESGVAYVRRWDDLTDTKETR